MACPKLSSLFFTIIFYTTINGFIQILARPTTHDPYQDPRKPAGVKAAYWPSFTGFPASSIETSYFTHIYYAFLLPSPTTFKLNITPFDQEKLPEFIGGLHLSNPPVKTLLSIGGGGNDPVVFSKIAGDRTSRAIFINSTIETARAYSFDGVDLDWEFPTDDRDMSNLGLLYKEWREALEIESKNNKKNRLLLTSAVYYASKITLSGSGQSYPGQMIRKYVDWVSPMCFDYHGSWDRVTGEHSALYDPNSDINTNFGVHSWIKSGIPPEKIVMGLPLYGRTWKLRDPNLNGVGSPAVGPGPGGGILVYSEVVGFNRVNGSVVKFDNEYVSVYSYVGDSWVGYDDPVSIGMKIRVARSWNLGGYFFWALGQDYEWILSREASRAWGY